ncbi:MAG: hypothetical protein ABR518_02265 [Actinomycetota bacterium]
MDDPWRAVAAAARDETSGAAEIARAAAAALLRLEPNLLPDTAEMLVRGHPSMAPLWRLATEALSEPDGRSAVRRFVDVLDRDRASARLVADVMPATVMTLSRSSAVIDAIVARRPDRVLAMRSEPGGEGADAAAALREAGIAAVVIDDDEALATMPAEAVVVGSDAITPTAVVNKVRTAALAAAARTRGLPCYVVAGESKLVGVELPPIPPFERTDLGLFTAVAMPDGMVDPAQIARRARTTRIHERLVPTLEELGGRV